MKYMVVECHLSYAIVLDEDGHFLKVANMNYEVGQTVDFVVEMQEVKEEVQNKKWNFNLRWFTSMVAIVACLILTVTTVLNNQTYASVFLKINPEVRIDVNRKDIVVGLTGVNEDGMILTETYQYKKKSLDMVMDELMDLAIEKGYLSAGGQITLTLDAQDNEWIVTHSESISTHVDDYLKDKMTVIIEIEGKTGDQKVDVPITHYGESDYEDTDYGPNNDGVTDYEDTDYGPNNDGVTNYEDTDYGPNNDGVTDYDDTDDLNDGQTDYGISNYETNISPYEDNGGDSGYEEDKDDGDSEYDD